MLFNEAEDSNFVFHEIFSADCAVQNQVCLVFSAHRGTVEIALANHCGELFNSVKLPVAPVDFGRLSFGQFIDHGVGQIPRSVLVLAKVDSVPGGSARVVRVAFGHNVPIIAPVAFLIGRFMLEDEGDEGVKTGCHAKNPWGSYREKYSARPRAGCSPRFRGYPRLNAARRILLSSQTHSDP